MRALTRPDPEYNCNPTTEISRLRSYRDATHVDSILDHRGRRPPPTPPRLTNLRVDPPTHRLRKGQRLQERVAGRAIGTVQPGATDFAHGVKMLNVGPAAGVGDHAPARASGGQYDDIGPKRLGGCGRRFDKDQPDAAIDSWQTQFRVARQRLERVTWKTPASVARRPARARPRLRPPPPRTSILPARRESWAA